MSLEEGRLSQGGAATEAVSATGRKQEKSRFFLLQGGFLRYFKKEADSVPKGQLCLPMHGGRPAANVVETEDHQFVVKTDELPDGLVLRGEDAADTDAWIAAIRQASTLNVEKTASRMRRVKTLMASDGFHAALA